MIKRYKYSILISAIICYLSLKSSSVFDMVKLSDFPNSDKLVHTCMYFGFTATLIFETVVAGMKKRLICVLLLIPFFFGILMEFLQGLLTTTRSASIYDIMFNTLGIVLAVAGWVIINAYMKKLWR